MQTVTQSFTNKSTSPLRNLSWKVFISWTKVFNSSTKFFTIGSSSIGGPDIIKGSGAVIQEWDKYSYDDFTNRILNIEYTRETDIVENFLVQAQADVTLDNHDDYFNTNNINSPLYGNILPFRPIRIHIGFSGEVIPIFIGLTEGYPKYDETNKTVTFHCIDFLNSVSRFVLDNDVIRIGQTTSQIISGLLVSAGLSTSQFSLDPGAQVVPFAYYPSGTNVGDALKKLLEAEMGVLFMDENGIITFKSRTSWSTGSPTYNLDWSNILDISSPTDQNIINTVIVKANPRELSDTLQKVWESSEITELANGASVDIFANFMDEFGALPVFGTLSPPQNFVASTDSYYQANSMSDGSGADVGTLVSLTSNSVFSTAYKMTFTNTSGATAYLTKIVVYAFPAKVVNPIYLQLQNSTSVAAYDERSFEIDNDYIQTKTDANTLAQVILDAKATAYDEREIKIIGVPQLQVGNIVTYTDRIRPAIVQGERPLIASIYDDFNDFSLNRNIWVKSEAGGATVNETNGRLEIPLPASSTSSTYGDIESVAAYDFRGGNATIQIIQVPSAASNADAELRVYVDISNNWFHWVYEAGTLYAQRRIGGVTTTVTSVAFSGTTHKYWRILESGGTISWQTSSNGADWTTQGTYVTTLDMKSVRALVAAFCYQNETNPGSFVIDNFNSPPSFAVKTYLVTKVNGILNENGFIQNITVRSITLRKYFQIGISSIGSTTDVIGP